MYFDQFDKKVNSGDVNQKLKYDCKNLQDNIFQYDIMMIDVSGVLAAFEWLP